tara:strand:- start:1276 stop:1995 length:720 start_codon:yes stop_codon:yes gene_type:complete
MLKYLKMYKLISMLCLMLTLICTGLIFYESPLDKPLYLRYQNITDVDNELISNNEILDSIFKEKYIQDLIKSKNYKEAETYLEKIKSIKDINVFLNNNYELEFNFTNRIPVAYLNDSKRFVDINGVLFDLDLNQNQSYLIEIDGKNSEKDLLKIIKVISISNDDNFFENKLKKIWFKNDDIYMKFNDMDFSVRLGNAQNIRSKLKVLKGFYAYQSKNLFKQKYKQVDLVYDNRLIAIKK